ncbi:MAG TPA: iron-sulfur cluster assembly scaffold protein, partial [Planctomycetaceae bacterium]|nr:iron-sulfur cluster assembly scaffold protein [Planctomycetaceae bacterium]
SGGWKKAIMVDSRRLESQVETGSSKCTALFDHARSPHHRGQLATASHVQAVRHPTCGDQVCLQVRIDESGRVGEGWFDGRGCLVSQAAASILCETIEGRRVADLRDFSAEAFVATIGTPLTPARRGCALLAWQALHAILVSIPDESVPSASAA